MAQRHQRGWPKKEKRAQGETWAGSRAIGEIGLRTLLSDNG